MNGFKASKCSRTLDLHQWGHFKLTFGEQNTEKQAHDILAYSLDQCASILDTLEIFHLTRKIEGQLIFILSGGCNQNQDASCKSGTTDYHSLLQVISIVKKLWAKIVSQDLKHEKRCGGEASVQHCCSIGINIFKITWKTFTKNL